MTMNKKPLLVYLHGLNSAPDSEKAQCVLQYVKSHALMIDCWIPQLPTWPEEVKSLLLQTVLNEAAVRPICVVGSSLGGFFGTWLQAQLQTAYPDRPHRLVLVNPAAQPFDLFEQYIGPQENTYTGEQWELTTAHVDQLRTMAVSTIKQPEDIFLLVQAGDETLDYRQAVDKYPDALHLIEEGGSHAFDHFNQVLPKIFSFLIR